MKIFSHAIQFDLRISHTFFLALFSCAVFAQTYTHPTTGIAFTYAGSCMVNTCSGTYYDDGGAASNYSNGIGDATFSAGVYRVFCPNTALNCISATFTMVDIQTNATCSKDFLTIGNGATQNSTTIAIAGVTVVGATLNKICGTPAVPFTVTSTDPSGCLVFRFASNNSTNAAGWAATISCTPCAGGPSGTDNNDCINSQTICYDVPISSVDYGPGLVSEACLGCTAGGENYSTWYDFCFDASGTLAFTIDPVNNSDDYDFALYGPGVDCNTLGSPIRCSYSGMTGNTGMASGYVDLSENVAGDSWVSTLNVTAGECYYLMVNHWTPPVTGYTIDWTLTAGASFDPCIFLPIELTSFTAEPVENNTVGLTWITETEMNNDHYVIEKSFDGVNFQQFMDVAGQLNSTEKTIYYAVDLHPAQGVNYYKLSQVDVNGDINFLETVSCNMNFNEAYGNIMVYDLSGKIIFNSPIYRNQIDMLLESLDLDNGVFVYNYIQNNGYTETGKFSTLK